MGNPVLQLRLPGHGWFASPTGGVNKGWFDSFVGLRDSAHGSRLRIRRVAERTQAAPLPLIAGAYVSAGAGLMATNAQNVSQHLYK